MLGRDLLRWVWRALVSQRLRSTLTLVGMAIGITAVCLMSALGEGLRQYMLREFTQFGSHLMAVTPGKTETFGLGGILNTVRPLSLDDAAALAQINGIERVVPVVFGSARVTHQRRGRYVNVGAVGPAAADVWQLKVAQGRFLPDDDLQTPRAFAVLGSKLKQELFGTGNALGEYLHIGASRYRIAGVLAPKGQFLGTDMDDTVYIPAARGLQLFNRESLMEIDLVYRANLSPASVANQVHRLLLARHGLEDFTLITQDEVLKSLDKILRTLKYAGAGLGAISLLVGGVGILSIMLITTTERTPEVGLLRALGCTSAQIRNIFLGEAMALALTGCLLGLMITALVILAMRLVVPAFPTTLPVEAVALSLTISLLIGALAGVSPALQASKLNPVEALRQTN